VGIGTAIFWGVLMGFFSLIPVSARRSSGSTALWLAVTGHVGKGLLVAAICGICRRSCRQYRPAVLLRNRTHLKRIAAVHQRARRNRGFWFARAGRWTTIVAAAMGVFACTPSIATSWRQRKFKKRKHRGSQSGAASRGVLEYPPNMNEPTKPLEKSKALGSWKNCAGVASRRAAV